MGGFVHARSEMSRDRRQFLSLAALAAAALAVPSVAEARATVVPWFGDERPGSIVISVSERRLYLVTETGDALSWRIAVGKEGRQWFGTTRVTHKTLNPTWRPTPRMLRENPNLPSVVGPGPRNPMGVAALYLADATLRIHGTNAPRSIGRAASSGCFRMHNSEVLELYRLVDPGARVYVVD